MKLTLVISCLVGLALPTFAQELLTVGFNGDVHRLDAQTGATTFLNNSGWKYTNALARNRAGEFYTVAQDNLTRFSPATLVRIDPQTGLGTAVAPSSINAVRGLAFGPRDELYAVILGTPFELHLLDVATGASTWIAELPPELGAVQALAYRGDRLYGWACLSSGDGAGLITIDPRTGRVTDPNPRIGGGCLDVQGLAFDDHGNLFGSLRTLYSIKPSPSPRSDVGVGSLTPLWTHGLDVRGCDFVTRRVVFSERSRRSSAAAD